MLLVGNDGYQGWLYSIMAKNYQLNAVVQIYIEVYGTWDALDSCDFYQPSPLLKWLSRDDNYLGPIPEIDFSNGSRLSSSPASKNFDNLFKVGSVKYRQISLPPDTREEGKNEEFSSTFLLHASVAWKAELTKTVLWLEGGFSNQSKRSSVQSQLLPNLFISSNKRCQEKTENRHKIKILGVRTLR